MYLYNQKKNLEKPGEKQIKLHQEESVLDASIIKF